MSMPKKAYAECQENPESCETPESCEHLAYARKDPHIFRLAGLIRNLKSEGREEDLSHVHRAYGDGEMIPPHHLLQAHSTDVDAALADMDMPKQPPSIFSRQAPWESAGEEFHTRGGQNALRAILRAPRPGGWRKPDLDHGAAGTARRGPDGRRRPHLRVPGPRAMDIQVGTTSPLPDGAGPRRRLDKRPDGRRKHTTTREFPDSRHHSDPTSPRSHNPRGPPGLSFKGATQCHEPQEPTEATAYQPHQSPGAELRPETLLRLPEPGPPSPASSRPTLQGHERIPLPDLPEISPRPTDDPAGAHPGLHSRWREPLWVQAQPRMTHPEVKPRADINRAAPLGYGMTHGRKIKTQRQAAIMENVKQKYI